MHLQNEIEKLKRQNTKDLEAQTKKIKASEAAALEIKAKLEIVTIQLNHAKKVAVVSEKQAA